MIHTEIRPFLPRIGGPCIGQVRDDRRERSQRGGERETCEHGKVYFGSLGSSKIRLYFHVLNRVLLQSKLLGVVKVNLHVLQEKSEMFNEALKALQEKLGVEPVGAPPTGLCPLSHIAPLGFALAIKWMLELLCKMDKYVPSDEVRLHYTTI